MNFFIFFNDTLVLIQVKSVTNRIQIIVKTNLIFYHVYLDFLIKYYFITTIYKINIFKYNYLNYIYILFLNKKYLI